MKYYKICAGPLSGGTGLYAVVHWGPWPLPLRSTAIEASLTASGQNVV